MAMAFLFDKKGLVQEVESSISGTNTTEYLAVWIVNMADIPKVRDPSDNLNSSASTSTPASNGFLTSPRFKSSATIGTPAAEWLIQLIKSKDEDGIEYLSVYLRLIRFLTVCTIDSPTPTLDAIYNFEIWDPNFTKPLYWKNSTIRRFGPTEDKMCWGWKKFIRFHHLGSVESFLRLKLGLTIFEPKVVVQRMIGGVLVQDKALLNSEATKWDYSKAEPMDTSEAGKIDIGRRRAMSTEEDNINSKKMLTTTMWKNKKGSDVNVCCGDLTFKVHKYILCACSKAFEEQLEKCEVQNGILQYKIHKQEPCVVEGMLEYCYTGNTKLFKTFFGSVKLCKIGHQFRLWTLVKDAFIKQILHCSQGPIQPDHFLYIFKNTIQFVMDEPECLSLLGDQIAVNLDLLQESDHFNNWVQQGRNKEFFKSLLFS